MRRDVRYCTDDTADAHPRRPRKAAAHQIDRREYLFKSEEDTNEEGKIKKKYNRNEQKRMNLHRLH